MASYVITNITSSSMSFRVKDLTAGDKFEVIVRLDSDPDDRTFNQWFGPVSTDTFFLTIPGLLPNTRYAMNIRHNPGGTGLNVDMYWVGTQRFTTLGAIEPWTWSASNGRATDAQTIAAYNAVTNQGYLSNFSYLVWNDMCDKVQDTIDAEGGWWRDTYGTYEETLMSAYDKDLTARRFNALRQNIGERVSTGITERSKGDIVYGWYFTKIMTSLNTWIASL